MLLFLSLVGAFASHQVETSLSFLSEEQFFPTEYEPSTKLVKVCQMDKLAQKSDIASRPFNRASNDCKYVTLADLSKHVEANCPNPEISFVHHLPHSGSTLLASMLESAPGVRSWSEYHLFNKLTKHPKVAKILTQAMACTPSSVANIEHMVVKMSSVASSLSFGDLRSIFPQAPWVFLYRSPDEVLAKLCKPAIKGISPFCQLGGKPLSPQNAASMLAYQIDMGIKHILNSAVIPGAGLGMALDYANLLDSIPQLIAHFGLRLSDDDLSNIMHVAKFDPKQSKMEGDLVDYRDRRESEFLEQLLEHPHLKRQADKLAGRFDQIRDVNEHKGHIIEQPKTFPLREIFEHWDPKDVSVPSDADRHHTLQVVEERDRPTIEDFQANEVPFIVRSKSVSDVHDLWNEEFLSETLPRMKQERSSDNRHMFYGEREKVLDKNFKAPTESSRVSYREFIDNVAAENSRSNEERSTLYGIVNEHGLPFIGQHLDILKSRVAWDQANAKPWQCKIGMPGIRNEAHFDRTRNLVAMISGTKRWVIVPPRYVAKLGLSTSGAFYRHASFDWSDEANWDKFEGVEGIDVVLKEGDVLYLPYGWTHYVLSTDDVNEQGVNIQCNAFSGLDSQAAEVINENFPAKRIDTTRCEMVMKSCQPLIDSCLKGSCALPHVVYSCYKTAMDKELERDPGFQCMPAKEKLIYNSVLCNANFGQMYNTETCPTVPEYLMKRGIKRATKSPSAHARRLWTYDAACDNASYIRAPLNNSDPASIQGDFLIDATYNQNRKPRCHNMDFSQVFTNFQFDSNSGLYVSTYECESHIDLSGSVAPCDDLFFINDIANQVGWTVGYQGVGNAKVDGDQESLAFDTTIKVFEPSAYNETAHTNLGDPFFEISDFALDMDDDYYGTLKVNNFTKIQGFNQSDYWDLTNLLDNYFINNPDLPDIATTRSMFKYIATLSQTYSVSQFDFDFNYDASSGSAQLWFQAIKTLMFKSKMMSGPNNPNVQAAYDNATLNMPLPTNLTNSTQITAWLAWFNDDTTWSNKIAPATTREGSGNEYFMPWMIPQAVGGRSYIEYNMDMWDSEVPYIMKFSVFKNGEPTPAPNADFKSTASTLVISIFTVIPIMFLGLFL